MVGARHQYVNSEANVATYKDSIKSELAAGTMPKTGTISNCDKQTLINYIDAL